MKKIFVLVFGLTLSFTSQSQVLSKVDSVSYLVGNMWGNTIGREMPEVNKDFLIKGILDELNQQAPLINDEFSKFLNAYFKEKEAKKSAENAEANAIIKLKGENFLADNKKNPNIKVTATGLQYEILTLGNGTKPKEDSKVKVHYHGTTPEGKVFDSSVDRGEPITFPLNQVIAGWTEGLQLMPTGSKFRFFIPQELAYGENPQAGGLIEPFMPLVFEVELIEIEK